MTDAYIIDSVRTPFGKRDGSFKDTHPQDLAAEPLKALEERNDFDGPNDIEDVIYGCVTPVEDQGMNIARLAPMVAGWGDDVPGVQLNRMCGSGQQSMNFAAANLAAGFHDVLIGGGVEHMTRVPMGSDGSSLTDEYFQYFDELTTQGEGAERIAEQNGFTRDDVDQIAADSQSRWGEAAEAGYYDTHVTSVETEVDGESVVVEEDEHPRPDTDKETLSGLPLAFRDEDEGVIHAGNSSGIVDGAGATLMASENGVDEHGWEPKARIVDTHVVGVDPVTMLTGPVPATNEILEENDMSADDIDYFEVNEAFASVVNLFLQETGATWDRTNVWGGAIAHGHPLGATGTALMGKLTNILHEEGGEYGLCTMCIGFGQGIATIIERV